MCRNFSWTALRHSFSQFHLLQIAIIQYQQRGRMMKLVMTNLVLFLFPFCIFSAVFAQNSNQPATQTSNQPAPIPLWASGAPGAKGDAPEDVPSVQLYQSPADKATGAAIIVCPGGGYSHLASHEG